MNIEVVKEIGEFSVSTNFKSRTFYERLGVNGPHKSAS